MGTSIFYGNFPIFMGNIPFLWELSHFCWNFPTSMGTGARLALVCFASDFAKGALLNQRSQEAWQRLAFFSKKYTPTQITINVYDRELLNQWSQEAWQSRAPVLIEMGMFPRKWESSHKNGKVPTKMGKFP
jgi:RNase H-like domain found in reverse transcriptase